MRPSDEQLDRAVLKKKRYVWHAGMGFKRPDGTWYPTVPRPTRVLDVEMLREVLEAGMGLRRWDGHWVIDDDRSQSLPRLVCEAWLKLSEQ